MVLRSESPILTGIGSNVAGWGAHTVEGALPLALIVNHLIHGIDDEGRMYTLFELIRSKFSVQPPMDRQLPGLAKTNSWQA